MIIADSTGDCKGCKLSMGESDLLAAMENNDLCDGCLGEKVEILRHDRFPSWFDLELT